MCAVLPLLVAFALCVALPATWPSCANELAKTVVSIAENVLLAPAKTWTASREETREPQSSGARFAPPERLDARHVPDVEDAPEESQNAQTIIAEEHSKELAVVTEFVVADW